MWLKERKQEYKGYWEEHPFTSADWNKPKPLNNKNDFVKQIDSQDTLNGIEMIDADFSDFEITTKAKLKEYEFFVRSIIRECFYQ